MEFNIVDKLMGITLLGAEWILWLLLFTSVWSIAIIIERCVFFLTHKIHFNTFRQNLSQALDQKDMKAAREVCLNSPSLETHVILSGIDNWEKSSSAVEGAMDGLFIAKKPELEKGLVVLGTLGSNAPFIGLFGTVIGIIKAFHDLATKPEGGPSVVMAGISEALIATAVGLMVAIPAIIAYNLFQKIIKGRVANTQAAQKILLSYHEKG